MLECTKLNFYYGAAQRLKDVSFVANSGSIGLFGHNGSGKTTLLKMLGGTLPIRFGNYLVFNKSSIDSSGYLRTDLRHNFGILFQGTSSDEKLSAYYNLVYGAKLMGIPSLKINDIVRETLIHADLIERADEPIKKFSGGMRRRLELYRCFMHRPKIVLLDEPTAGLDAHESAKFVSFIKHYQKQTNALVIISTHRADEIIEMDRVLMMKDGEIIADLSPKSLVADLNYVRCSFSLHNQQHTKELFISLFDVEHKENDGIICAKLPFAQLDSFLKSPFLRDRKIKAFSIEDPTISDAYQDICRRRGAQ